MSESRVPRRRSRRAAEAPQLDAGLQHLERIFSEFGELHALTGRLAAAKQHASEGTGEDGLRIGVEAIQDAIKKTRREISSLHAKGFQDRQFNRATDELDAVVADTESATESILSAAEDIDRLATGLARELGLHDSIKLAEIQQQVVRIFEACNFQDISGQRISKVVGLLHFIESCVGTMTDIWGPGEAGDAPDQPAVDDDAALLNGPSRAGGAGVVSQDDIDSLFR